jgi:hypothetical protein
MTDSVARLHPGQTGVSRMALAGWIAAFTALEWIRFKLQIGGGFHGLGDVPHLVSALECFELFLLARMFATSPPSPRIGAVEAWTTLAGIALAALVAQSQPLFAAGLLAIYLFARFGREAERRGFALGVFIFIAQYLLQSGPFIWLHAFVGRIDAVVVAGLLQTAGHDVQSSGTLLFGAAPGYAIDIMEGCASSFVCATVIAGAAITILGLRGRLLRADLVWLALAAALAVAINWLRLMPVALSHDGWLYWHEGAGSALVSAADGLLAVAGGWLAVRRTP